MKKVLFMIMAVTVTAFSTQAQEKKNKNTKADVEVRGNCGICKKRIEKAAYSVKGVKQAEWHKEDQTLHLIVDETKTSVKNIQEAIAKVGHDTKYKDQAINATEEDYKNLHTCCVYERE